MSVRKLKPVTPGQRFRVVNGFDAAGEELARSVKKVRR